MLRKYFANRTFDLLAVLSIVLVVLLTACSGTSSSAASSATATSTSTGATGGNKANATLKHLPYGTSTFSWNPTAKALTVKISLTGLAPSSTHPAQIYSGSCAKQGPVVYSLNAVMANAKGVGTSTTAIKNVNTVKATGWYIDVHNGPGLTAADEAVSIVCSDLTLPNLSPTSSSSAQVPLNSAPASSPNETASGTAQLALTGTTLTVRLMLTGLQPHSSHAAHIHAGSCLNQGGAVIYPLTNVVADATGKANETTSIKNVKTIPASGWYVNVHYSTNITTQTGFNPIACGNVIL
jgi:Cu/Zn superoxide dismutase